MEGRVLRQSSSSSLLRPASALTPRPGSSSSSSSSFRKLYNSSRTPRSRDRSRTQSQHWTFLLCLLLIALWAYLAFYLQSNWAHHAHNQHFPPTLPNHHSRLLNNSASTTTAAAAAANTPPPPKTNNIHLTLSLAKKTSSRRRTRHRHRPRKYNATSNHDIPKPNNTFSGGGGGGLIVGPFASTEERILNWSARRPSGSCNRDGDFARLVSSRNYVLIFHELSITGAPLSMMELATELISCGATVSAVLLSKKGGLLQEITRRNIKVLEDKDKISFKAATKADLVIAGSAVCATWIEQYHDHFPAGCSQVAWWIMENRREYFNRSKLMLNRVKMLIFLSESQSKQWLAWCQEEGIKLYTPSALIPLSVHDELAFVAGIPCSLNTPSFTVEEMLKRRQLLRDAVRKEMGLIENDMLVMSLSSINPGKGQLLLLESARLTVGRDLSVENTITKMNQGGSYAIINGQNHSSVTVKKKSRALFQNEERIGESGNVMYHYDKSNRTSNKPRKNIPMVPNHSSNNHTDSKIISSSHNIKKLLSDNERTQKQALKVLVGSVGSKSNKAFYVKGLLQFLSQHSELSKIVLWTPATTHVASLYSAADVYVINSQGLGETFGRVTIEAMAYGLPVLGTDAGGTKEIVDHNVTGLLHPLGRPGIETLAKNLFFFLKNPAERNQMGMRGKRKVEKIYLKHHMYKKFAEVLSKCMRPK